MTGQMELNHETRRMARSDDRPSSFAAAETVNAASQRDQVLAALRLYPGTTALELSKRSRIPHPVCHKRLPDLRNRGEVRSEPDGTKPMRWYVKEE